MIRVILLSIAFVLSMEIFGQIPPYTGGDGSGYYSVQYSGSACPYFRGGNGSGGYASILTQSLCPLFLGGTASGGSANMSAQSVCPPFWGGNGSGANASDSSGCNIILPVKLITFYGEKEPLRNILRWKVGDWSEIRTFEVEKSITGAMFNIVGTVMARANDNKYLFVDNEAGAPVVFYRLKIIENDNSGSYSEVIAIRRFLRQTIKLYPNPTTGVATLYCYSDDSKEVTLQLNQLDGKEVFSKQVHLKKGVNNIPAEFHNIPNGLYVLRIIETNEEIKIIIRR